MVARLFFYIDLNLFNIVEGCHMPPVDDAISVLPRANTVRPYGVILSVIFTAMLGSDNCELCITNCA